MARGSNQKLKILYLYQFFQRKTDKTNGVTMEEIINHLVLNGINAERKSIYSDIEALRNQGFIIEKFKENNKIYYRLITRDFETAELKLLVDAVQSSKFLTQKKSQEIIKKISNFASEYEEKSLKRQVYVANRVKTMNESIYSNVDKLHQAINHNKQIEFKYLEWTLDKKLNAKNNGLAYQLSPWALMWDNENYYMVAFDATYNIIKHFRIDKMKSIEVLEETREGKQEFKNFDMAVYSQKMFCMFGGTNKKVKLLVKNELVGVMIDRFGKNIMIIPKDKDYFVLNIEVEVSQQFLAWIFGLGNRIKILGPEEVVLMMKEEIKRIEEVYEGREKSEKI